MEVLRLITEADVPGHTLQVGEVEEVEEVEEDKMAYV